MKSIKKISLSRGQLLISQPLINDDFFHNSVVFLSEFTEDGIVGFIVNKPLRMSIHHLIDNFPKFATTLYYGGPVESDNLYFIHRVPEKIKGSIHITKNLYWGGDFDQIKDLILKDELKSNEIRFFLGYSGWEEKQLNDEIASESWIVDEMEDSLFEWDMKNIWKERISKRGSDFQLWDNAPKDISLN